MRTQTKHRLKKPSTSETKIELLMSHGFRYKPVIMHWKSGWLKSEWNGKNPIQKNANETIQISSYVDCSYRPHNELCTLGALKETTKTFWIHCEQDTK